MKFSNLFLFILIGTSSCAVTHSQRSPAQTSQQDFEFTDISGRLLQLESVEIYSGPSDKIECTYEQVSQEEWEPYMFKVVRTQGSKIVCNLDFDSINFDFKKTEKGFPVKFGNSRHLTSGPLFAQCKLNVYRANSGKQKSQLVLRPSEV